MSNREPLLPIAWERSEAVRKSVVLWAAAVACGAAFGVGAYYAISSDSSWMVALAGVLVGFFAPYVLMLIWFMTPMSADRTAEKEWANVKPIVRRTTR
jgi:hypothetical protein